MMMKLSLLYLGILVTLVIHAQSKVVTVSQSGNADVTTVQAAFDAVPINNQTPITIMVKNGIYKEKLHLDAGKNFVTLVGESVEKTILTYDDHTGKIGADGTVINTRTSYSFLLKANDFTAKNITFQNDAGFTAGQAVAAEMDGDKAAFYNCRFIGFQDVLFTNNDSSSQYYKNCYIEGTTDFIFGSATVWFQQCHIHSKKNSHVTAASTPANHAFGYVFNKCTLTGDIGLHGVSLGRPWQPYAAVVYLNCNIDSHILPEGWRNWNNTDNYKTARFAEYKNIGLGADTINRVTWAKQLSDEAAKTFTIRNIFGNWIPQK
jgi:pectinesterase